MQGPAEVTPAWVWLVDNNVGVMAYSFSVNISPNMPCGVLVYDIAMLQNHMLIILE